MYKHKKFLVVIPARSGSVSIENKNLQKAGADTLVVRSIKHAQKSKYVDQIVVSTNGSNIKEEALKSGIDVLDRPEEISGPLSSTEETLLHVLGYYSASYIVCLQPTSPFRFENLIDRCIERIVNESGDSLIACWKFHDFCFYRVIEDGNWLATYDYQNRPMRQSLGVQEFKFFDCGNLYITKTEFLLKRKCRLGGKIVVEPVSLLESLQIDSIDELELCQKIANGEIK